MPKELAARQRILIRAVIVIALVAILRIGALLGWFPPDWVLTEDAVQDWIDRTLAAIAAYSAWRAVTPGRSAPRQRRPRAGARGVPAKVVQPRLHAAVALSPWAKRSAPTLVSGSRWGRFPVVRNAALVAVVRLRHSLIAYSCTGLGLHRVDLGGCVRAGAPDPS